MKIVTWNCNGALRRKYAFLANFDADILIIQECEDPAQSYVEHYRKWAANYLWHGDNKNKGLGIFCKQDIVIEKNNWDDNDSKYFLSVRVNRFFNLLAVWNQRSDSYEYRYIGQFWKYLQQNKEVMQGCIIAGDFNSNKIWDIKSRRCNHSDVVRELEEMSIKSLYHQFFNSLQGEEKHPTLYLQRNKLKGYHIDYIFAHDNFANNMSFFEIGDMETWLKISDHLPVFVEFRLVN